MKPATTLRRHLACGAALVLAACGGPKGSGKAPAGAEPERVTVSQVFVAYRHPKYPDVKRSKEQAKELADSILRDLAAGRSFESLMASFSELRDEKGALRTNNGVPGSWTYEKDQLFEPLWDAAVSVPPGSVVPEPVASEYAWHVLRRDR
jgi:hypothetical protein